MGFFFFANGYVTLFFRLLYLLLTDSFIDQFITPSVVSNCCVLLSKFETNSDKLNRTIIQFFEKISSDVNFNYEPMFYQVSIFILVIESVKKMLIFGKCKIFFFTFFKKIYFFFGIFGIFVVSLLITYTIFSWKVSVLRIFQRIFKSPIYKSQTDHPVLNFAKKITSKFILMIQ